MDFLPSPERFFLELAPYQELRIGKRGWADVLRLQFYTDTLDTYCVECGRESVFRSLVEPMHEAHGRPTQARPVGVDDLLDGKKLHLPYNACAVSFQSFLLRTERSTPSLAVVFTT